MLHIERLTLEKGIVYGVIGPSGAGKSTLLRIINLLTPPDSGLISFHGRSVPANGVSRLDLQQKMTMVFQKPLLFKASVRENVAYGLKARGYSRADINRRVDSLLEQVGMDHLAERRADLLSGGEAQRVAVARAVAFEPELLLLDEPTANLDPANVELIENMVIQMHRSRTMTTVLVTHNIFQARRIADQVIFLNQGQIVEMGDKNQIFYAPGDEKTRAYIEGRMVY